MAWYSGVLDGISDAFKSITGNVAKEVSQTKAGSLSGIFSDWKGVMGEAGDLGAIATRMKVSKEAMSAIGNSKFYKNAADGVMDEIDTAMKTFIREGNEEGFNKIIGEAVAGGGAEEAISKFQSGTWSKYQNIRNMQGDAMYKEFFGKDAGVMAKAGAYYKDPVYGGNRIAATAGTMAIGGVGIRYLQGGSLTRKANGENDIAGVPFI